LKVWLVKAERWLMELKVWLMGPEVEGLKLNGGVRRLEG
jgi:hypothetical protein